MLERWDNGIAGSKELYRFDNKDLFRFKAQFSIFPVFHHSMV